MGQFHKLSVFIEYEQMSLVNADANVSREVRGVILGQNLHLHPYFVHASSEGSGKSANMCRLALGSDCSLIHLFL